MHPLYTEKGQIDQELSSLDVSVELRHENFQATSHLYLNAMLADHRNASCLTLNWCLYSALPK